MNIHKNARLTDTARSRGVCEAVAEPACAKGFRVAAGVCPRMMRKWVECFKIEL